MGTKTHTVTDILNWLLWVAKGLCPVVSCGNDSVLCISSFLPSIFLMLVSIPFCEGELVALMQMLTSLMFTPGYSLKGESNDYC